MSQSPVVGDSVRVNDKDGVIHCEDQELGSVDDKAGTNMYHESEALPEFDPKVLRRLRLKIDLWTVPMIFLISGLAFLDRANIGNARLAGLEKDLGMQGNDFNIVLTIFWVVYIVLEVPALVACKYFGPGWFLPAMTVGYGLMCLLQAWAHNMAQMCALRVMIALFEAPVLAGCAYYYSRWYTRAELTFRLGLSSTAGPIMGATSGLAASAILTLDHFGSLTRWRMIFAIEGMITLIIAAFLLVLFTDRPETARWLTEEEKKIVIARIKAERVATTEVLDGIDKAKLLRGLINPAVIAVGFIFCLTNITAQGYSFFLPTIIKSIYPNKSVVHQQLWSVPPYAVGLITNIGGSYLSWRFDRRIIVMVALLPLVILGYGIFLGTLDSQARYGATVIIAFAIMPFQILCQSQVAANVVSDTARSSALALNIIIGNIGGLISTWAFTASDAPHYIRGSGLNIASACTSLLLAIGVIFWMKWDNKRRATKDPEAELSGLSLKQVHDLDWAHPGFRWKP
ncbi:uncharacterized protein Z520_04402 [Fonsecaea multimorphosa CBS 102226]|uniref:Major facilitator superfamily (MFS) profile domain-containing protein n=1 Tax=Fonsecaea multimorphosa CBS 102226 TaxID=1442371 RepID=A0A0D2IRY8_9EURO|nr:uncharacterized protein Z520_04402 [Fonsecaea multimorphosa CBS 102226]KIX99766.1 hypothetical protein Z520_04402 [Fonsecaea multimorphosa CBS 102226]OAL26554.1 hypothetical protein AYO22_04165 [Fonsecaea multimorphosa]